MTHSSLLRPRPLALACATALTLAGAANAEIPTRDIPRVVVTAAGYEQALQQAPASITIISGETLQRQDVRSLAEALRGIEGVNVLGLDSRDGKTGNQSISLRGLPRDYTLVLIDGVRQNPRANVTPNSFNDSQSVFIPPISAIERIEVIRGPMSSLYGSDALGGVVNIITRRSGQEWGGTAAVAHVFQGDRDFGATSALDFHASGPLTTDRMSMQIHGRVFDLQRSDIDIPGVMKPRPVTSDTPTMGQNPVAARTYTLGGRLVLSPTEQHELSVTFNSTRQNYDNRQGDIGALHRTGSPAQSACNTTAAPNFCRGYATELEFNRDQLTLGHVGTFAAGTWTTQLTRDALETIGRTLPLNSGLAPSREGGPRTLELDTNIIDSQFVLPRGRHTLVLGGQYIDPKFTDGLAGGASNTVTQYSVFAEDEWRVTDSLALTGGLRYDDNQAFSGKWTPRLYAVWEASKQWTLKGGIGRGFRAPNVEQLTDGIIGFGNQGSVPIFGNPGLRPETSTNIEAAAGYRSGGVTAQATVFRNDVGNLIEAGTGANSGRALNIGRARIQGVEFAGQVPLVATVSLSGNYTFTDSEVIRTQLDTGAPSQLISSRLGDPLASVPRHMANATLAWKPAAAWSAFLQAESRSSAFRPRNFHEPQTGGSSQGQVAAGVRDSREVIGDFKGYTLLNLGASYRISERLTLSGVLYNLLDHDFQDYRAYNRCSNAGCTNTPGSAMGFSNGYNTIQEPRRLWLSLTAGF